MAQTKNPAKRSGKQASSGQSGKKKPTTKSTEKPAAKSSNGFPTFLSQTAPYLTVVLSLLAAFCLIFGEGSVGGWIRDVLTGLFGGAAYALPVFVLYRVFRRSRDAEEGLNAARNTATAVVFVLLTMLLHVFGGESVLSAGVHYADGKELTGGGVVGGMLGELFVLAFGKVCTTVILIAAAGLLFLYALGITPRGALIEIAYRIKSAGEKRSERRAAMMEQRKNAPPTRAQVKEEEHLAYLREKREQEREARRLRAQTAQPEAGSAGENPPRRPLEIPEVPDLPEEAPVKLMKKIYRVTKVTRRRQMEKHSLDGADVTVNTETGEVLSIASEARENVPVNPEPPKPTEPAESQKKSGRKKKEKPPKQPEPEEPQVPEVDEDSPNPADEKLFEEVMRRTRERVEKARRAEHLRGELHPDKEKSPEEADVPPEKTPPHVIDVTPENTLIEEIDFPLPESVLPVQEEAAEPDEPDKDEAAEPAEPETDSVRLAVEEGSLKDGEASDDGEADSLSDIFATPEDAELLDRLAEFYRTPQEPHHEAGAALPSSEPQQKPVLESKPEYRFPPIEILAEDPGTVDDGIREELQDNAVKLVETLRSFNVKTKIVNISRGPTITRYELQPEPGTKVRSITNLVDDISLNMATGGVRIEAPIPGKAAVGVEVPNKKQSTVHLRTLIEDSRFVDAKSRLTVCLGEDVAGEAVYFDIAKMPHLLIAGATGSGKSVCINSIITSILYKASPEDVKLILIDPKKVELNIYNGIPHLLVPVVSEPKKAAGSLSWAVGEMERRYGLIEEAGVRDIKAFNEVTKNDPDYEYMPRIVLIIDELADLMMTAPDDVEESICRIAQKARAAGMHLIIGTQRPSVDVITGLIKANVPSRIAFRTSSQIDSRTIIDIGSAANLMGMGDMLFNPVGALKPNRVQGAYVSESDVEEVVSYIKNMNAAYLSGDSEKIVNEIEREAQKCGVGKKGSASADDAEEAEEGEDPLLSQALELAVESGKIATSLLQRRLSVGYGRAAKLIDRMEQLGYVSAPEGTKPRKVLVTRQELMELRLKDDAPFDV